MVDSVDEMKSSQSVEGEDFPNFELLDARIASALNKIIPNSHFLKKVSPFDGRDFNNRGGERGRQPISLQSCVEDSDHTHQKAAQVASAPPGPLSDVKTRLMVIRQKVDRNRARWSRRACEWLSRTRTLVASKERR